MTALLESLGERIKELRESQGLSKTALAEAAGISRKYVGDIEQGKYQVTVTVVVRVARALGTDGWALVQYAERKSR